MVLIVLMLFLAGIETFGTLRIIANDSLPGGFKIYVTVFNVVLVTVLCLAAVALL